MPKISIFESLNRKQVEYLLVFIEKFHFLALYQLLLICLMLGRKLRLLQEKIAESECKWGCS